MLNQINHSNQSDNINASGKINNKSRLAKIVAGSALTLALAAGFTGYAHTASAADTPSVTTVASAQAFGKGFNPESTIVNKIATKFNLSVADVQAAFDEARAEGKAEMTAQMKTADAARLSAAVTAGKLTQAQADLITAKKAEIKTQMEARLTAMKSQVRVDLSALTAEQRKTEMQKMQTERKAEMEAELTALKAWATANGIPAEYLNFLGGFGAGKGGPGFGGTMKR